MAPAEVFFREFREIFKNTYFTGHLWTAVFTDFKREYAGNCESYESLSSDVFYTVTIFADEFEHVFVRGALSYFNY